MIARVMTDVLHDIVEQKHKDIAAAKRERPFEALLSQLHSAPPVRDFVGALRASGGMGLIAEVKKASPSAGVMRSDFDPVAIAKTYAAHGAHCISVLTDETFFHGSLDHLRAVRASVSIPVLRKDFLLDRYQILEARVAGADCVLLIAECLSTESLKDLYACAHELGMSALVEIYEPANLQRVLELRPALLGVNNRNLKTFVTDLRHSIDLSTQVPESTLLISESGIRNGDDVARLRSAGVRGILVGETLMRSPDVGATIRELLG
jgi:indole-3-glycerol phosphate synthase